jgi:hypothetical protein
MEEKEKNKKIKEEKNEEEGKKGGMFLKFQGRVG